MPYLLGERAGASSPRLATGPEGGEGPMARVRRRRLVPVYHHGSEIEAVTRAGSTCPFYDATDSLAPDEAEVESLLGGDAAVMSVTFFLIFGP
jgi:hypothetical protein